MKVSTIVSARILRPAKSGLVNEVHRPDIAATRCASRTRWRTWFAPASWRSPAATRRPRHPDALRVDPAFKLARRRLPDTGANLCSQPTLSRLENAPSLKDAIRLTWALVDQWMASYDREPASCHSRYRRHLRCRARASAASLLTPTTTSAAFCRSMSMTPSARVPSRRAAPRQDPVGRRSAR